MGWGSNEMEGSLVLEDGTVVRGAFFGAPRRILGELVFNTNMTGYQEALTDPSYRGQILMFTYPLIGNYGMLQGTAQSERVQASGAILATLSSSWPERPSLAAYLEEAGVPAVHGVDTRAIAQQ